MGFFISYKKNERISTKNFDQCQSVSNLKFQYNSIKPDTYIFHFLMRCFSVIIIHGVRKVGVVGEGTHPPPIFFTLTSMLLLFVLDLGVSPPVGLGIPTS
jgi:secreted Zn-dependent insulinase-like peptidase